MLRNYFQTSPVSPAVRGHHLISKANPICSPEVVMKAPFLIGRLLFGGFFLYNGINHLRQRKNLAQYAQAKNVPMAEIGVIATGVALTIGGASVLLGVKPKLGSLAILGFLAGVSPVMHDFWRAEDANQRTNDMIHFMKNMALAGGALALMGIEEPWPVSVPVAQPDAVDRIRKIGRRSGIAA
jgi:putative oxidoreductase